MRRTRISTSKGKNKAGGDLIDPKMLEALDKLEFDLVDKQNELKITTDTLAVSMAAGEQAAAEYAASQKVLLFTSSALFELTLKFGKLDQDRVNAINYVTQAVANQTVAVMSNEAAWKVASSGIESGKDRYERAQDEVNALSLALVQLGDIHDEKEGGFGLSDEQVRRIQRRIEVLQGELTDTAVLAKEAFGSAITGLTSFIASGAQDVKGFISGMIAELGKLVVQFFLIRAVKGTAFEGVFGAKGMVLQRGNLVPFAQGGIVGGPTAFPMSGGRTGIMGEAGPEAVMPLARLPSGKLGVNSNPQNIEIINNTGVNATARIQNQGDRTSIILEAAELGAQMAEQRMTRSLRTGYGSASTTLQRTYALRRQG